MFRGKYLSSLRPFHVLLVGSCLFSFACHRLGSTEEKVVGTWEYTGFDSRSRIVFRRDHIMVVLIPTDGDDFNAQNWMPASWGNWRLDGNTIIVSNQQVFGLDGARRIGEVGRLPFREIHENRLVSDGDGSNWNRLSPTRERHAQLLSLFYLLAILAAVAAVIVAICKARLRRKIVVVGIAALGILSLSMMALLGELGRSGSLVISPRLIGWLQVPNDLCKMGLVMTLIVIAATLIYRSTQREERREGVSP